MYLECTANTVLEANLNFHVFQKRNLVSTLILCLESYPPGISISQLLVDSRPRRNVFSYIYVFPRNLADRFYWNFLEYCQEEESARLIGYNVLLWIIISVKRHVERVCTENSSEFFFRGEEATRGDTKKCWFEVGEKRKRRRREGKVLATLWRAGFGAQRGKRGYFSSRENGKPTCEKRRKSPRDVPLFRLPSLRCSNEWLKSTLRSMLSLTT